jgi:DNA-binding ferritin-like protein (Dps family)
MMGGVIFMNPRKLSLQNREKRALLAEANKEIYERILQYVRTANLTEHQLEEVLLDVLDHLLEAQEQGKTAHDVFGKDPKAYCHELIDVLPKQTFWQRLSSSLFVYAAMLCLLFVGDSISSYILNHLESKEQAFVFNPLGIILIIACTSIFVFFGPKFLRKTAFMKAGEGFLLLIGVPAFLFVMLISAASKGYMEIKEAQSFTIAMPFWVGIVLSISFAILYKLLSTKTSTM